MNSLPLRHRFTKRVFAIVVLHAVVFALAYRLSYGLKFDFAIPDKVVDQFWLTLPAILIIKLTIFYALGACHGWWGFVTFSDLGVLLKAATLSLLVVGAVDMYMVQTNHIPKSILLLDYLMTILLLGGLRSMWRLSQQELRPIFERKDYRRVLIVGANAAGEALARQLHADHRFKCIVVGFLDDDVTMRGARLGSMEVLGRPEEAPRYAAAFAVQDVLVSGGSIPGKRLRLLMKRCEDAGLTVKVVPPVDEILKNDIPLQIRPIDINDLLGRDPVKLNSDAIEGLLEGQTVLVTGAGGSIGSEICRQVLRFRPKQLILLERGENNLFLIEQELRKITEPGQIHVCVADILDKPRLSYIFEKHRPDVVFHAAAFKHVPMMEHNPGEAIKNNVFGTRQLVEIADRYQVRHFVMISTDKAVNPTSVMGVSKQLAERFVHAFAETSQTKFVVVRFGNVLASAGSVVPIFQEQIRRGGPVTVTHPLIERFFMTIPEASQLVLQAAAMGGAGEIFVLDMGDPVKIVDLAQDLIRLSGLKEGEDIEIQFTGLRPGEKLYEELYLDSEEKLATPHPKVFVAYHRPYTLDEVKAGIDELSAYVHSTAEALHAKLKEIVPEYHLPGTCSTLPEEAGNRGVPQRPVAVEDQSSDEALAVKSGAPGIGQ